MCLSSGTFFNLWNRYVEAWGSYWSWDPKETWALITWFVYATYLHSRLAGPHSLFTLAIKAAFTRLF